MLRDNLKKQKVDPVLSEQNCDVQLRFISAGNSIKKEVGETVSLHNAKADEAVH